MPHVMNENPVMENYAANTSWFVDAFGKVCKASDMYTSSWYNCTSPSKDGPSTNLERCCPESKSASGYCNFWSSPCRNGGYNAGAKSKTFSKEQDARDYAAKTSF